MLIVPILYQQKCWGHIGFDNCGELRLYDEAEIAILKIAADSIAAVIERQAKDEELLK
jgi:GAF domain-containing protein